MRFSKNSYTFAFFIITRLFVIFSGIAAISDIYLYFDYFNKIDYGLAPYKEFRLEYPPLAVIPIYFAGKLFSENQMQYCLAFGVIFFVFDCLCLKICQIYGKNHLKMNDDDNAYITFVYSLLGLLLYQLLYQRLDLIVALFLTTSLLFFCANKPNLRPSFYLNIVLGFFYKITPAFVFPVAVILKYKNDLIKIIKSALIFFAVLLCAIFIIEIITDHKFVSDMLFHQQRGIHVESFFGSILLVKNIIIGKNSIIYPNGSWDIKASQTFTNFSKFFGHIVLICFYAGLFFKFRNKKKITEENFLDATLITILLFLSFQRVFSPQFLIWLIPILSIWLTKNRSLKLLLIFLFIFLSTWAIFSIDYYALLNQEPILISILFIRNLALIGVTIFLLRKFFNDERKNPHLH